MESQGHDRLVSPFDQIVYSEFDQQYIGLLLIENKTAMDALLQPLLDELSAITQRAAALDLLDIESAFCLAADRARVEYQISLVRLRRTVRCVGELIRAGYRDSKACSDRREAQRLYDLQAAQLRQRARFYGLDVDLY